MHIRIGDEVPYLKNNQANHRCLVDYGSMDKKCNNETRIDQNIVTQRIHKMCLRFELEFAGSNHHKMQWFEFLGLYIGGHLNSKNENIRYIC